MTTPNPDETPNVESHRAFLERMERKFAYLKADPTTAFSPSLSGVADRIDRALELDQMGIELAAGAKAVIEGDDYRRDFEVMITDDEGTVHAIGVPLDSIVFDQIEDDDGNFLEVPYDTRTEIFRREQSLSELATLSSGDLRDVPIGERLGRTIAVRRGGRPSRSPELRRATYMTSEQVEIARAIGGDAMYYNVPDEMYRNHQTEANPLPNWYDTRGYYGEIGDSASW